MKNASGRGPQDASLETKHPRDEAIPPRVAPASHQRQKAAQQVQRSLSVWGGKTDAAEAANATPHPIGERLRQLARKPEHAETDDVKSERVAVQRSAGKTATSAGTGASTAPHAGLRQQIEKERDSIASASSLATLGGKLASAGAAVAPVRIANTVESAERARAYFDGPGAAALPDAKQRKDAFVDARMAPALADQKTAIKKAQDEELTKSGNDVTKINYDKAQNYAAFGANAKTVLAPECLDNADAEATVGAAQKKGGLAKVIGLATFFKAMNQGLRKKWDKVYGEPKALDEWKRQSMAQGKPAIVPEQLDPADRASYAAWADPASAFSGPLTGAMGVVNEYDDIKTFADAKQKLGLDEQYYDGGFCFMCFIPGANVPGAVERGAGGAGKDKKTTIGKPSLFSSLIWAEFNYIAEDRATNTTAAPEHGNSGSVDSSGKTEVTVANLSYSELFSHPVQVIR